MPSTIAACMGACGVLLHENANFITNPSMELSVVLKPSIHLTMLEVPCCEVQAQVGKAGCISHSTDIIQEGHSFQALTICRGN